MSSIAKQLQKVILSQHPRINLVLTKYPDHLYLDKIAIPEELRGQGIAGQVMKKICNFCDSVHLVCKLTPSSFFGSEYERLVQFYKRFGFEFEWKDEMKREPQTILP